MRRSRKPLYRKVPGVRIPPSPPFNQARRPKGFRGGSCRRVSVARMSALVPASVRRRLRWVRDEFRAIRQRRELRQARAAAVRRIVVGSSTTRFPGWISTDHHALDLLDEVTWARYFEPGSIDMLLAEHVWEHLDPADASAAARTCFKYLRVGGHLRVAVPDGG